MSCSWSGTDIAPPDWQGFALCAGFSMEVVLPDSESQSNGQVVPKTVIEHASIVVSVTHIGNYTGNFTIGSCDHNEGLSVTTAYDALEERTRLPLITVVPSQCATFEHKLFSSSRHLDTASSWAHEDHIVKDLDRIIRVQFALIGDFCKTNASEICQGHNTKATSPPSQHSGANSHVQWARQTLVVYLIAVTVLGLSYFH